MKRQNWYLSTIDPQAGKLAREYGLGLEIAEYCTAVNLDDNLKETDRAVGQKMKSADRFILHGPFNELFPCAVDPKARELAAFRYGQALERARACGIGKVVFHAGFNPYLYYPCWFEEQSVAFWRAFEIPDGMTVCLENVLEEKPEMLANILQAVDSPKLRLCLDVGHVSAYSKTPAEDWLRSCATWLSHFHIHNNDGSRDTHSGLTEGILPMEALLHLAEELCPDATFTLELPEAGTSVCWLKEKGFLEE